MSSGVDGWYRTVMVQKVVQLPVEESWERVTADGMDGWW